MSTSTHNAHHTRHSPPQLRKTARSMPSSKSASKSVSKSVSKSAGTPKITIKPAKATKQAKEEEEVFEDDHDDMGSSFLQFCAMCEKQIVVPNSSILYCSESCRHRDSALPTTDPYLALASHHKINPSTLSSNMDESFGSRIPTYVPALPFTPRSNRSSRIPAMAHDGNSDLDPTEWKPAEAVDTERKSPGKEKIGEWKPKLPHRPSSEAFSYLSKFHRSSDSLASKRRPTLGHARTTSRATPSLSHTPTASTSSEESLAGTPYEFVARPPISMPTMTTTTTSASNGVRMVKDGNDLTYEKKLVGASLGSATGSLKKLLGTATSGM